MRRRIAVAAVSIVCLLVVAAAFVLTRRNKPNAWFSCVGQARAGSLSVSATGHSSVLGLGGGGYDGPFLMHWKASWTPDAGTVEGDQGPKQKTPAAARALSSRLIAAAQSPGPHDFAALAILRVNVELDATCDGEAGHASFYTAPPTLADCRSTYELHAAQGRDCYLAWLSGTLHHGTPAADALLGAIPKPFEDDDDD